MRLLPSAFLAALLPVFMAAPAYSADPINVGFFSHMSGNFAEYGITSKNGAELYLDKIKAQGGLDGHPINMIYEDDRNSPQEAAAVARKLVADKVVLAIGSWSTTASLAAAPIFTGAKIPQISPTSSNPAFTKQSKYQFRQNNTDDVLAVYNAATIQQKLKANSIVIPYSLDDWGVYTGKATAAIIKKNGGTVPLLEGVQPNARDFRPFISKIKSLKPQGVFLALPYQEGSIFIQQLRQAGEKIPVGGGIPLTTPKFLQLAGPAAEGMVLHTLFIASDPAHKDFTDAYKAKFGRSPDLFAALAYDATGVGLAAIDRVLKSGKPLTGDAVRDELANGPAYNGVTGVTKYHDGNVHKDPVFIVVHNGKFELLK